MRRFHALDSLRGIAALVVLFDHTALVVPGVRDAVERTYVLRPLVAAPGAVYLFFVLSGFVLFRAFDPAEPYARYAARRLVRLYPPLLFAVLAAWGAYMIVAPAPVPALSDWFNAESWAVAPTAPVLIGHLLLFDAPVYHQLNNVIWSLVHEVRISLLFPLLAWSVRRQWIVTVALLTLLGMAAWHLQQLVPMPATVDPLETARFAYLFAAGAALALHVDRLRDWGARSRWGVATIMVAGLILISWDAGLTGTLRTAAGALLLVAGSAIGPAIERHLAHPALIWLGRVSYSLYLTHLICLLTIVHLLAGRVPMPLLLAGITPVALIVAGIVHRFVEQPAIQASRAIGRRQVHRVAAAE